MLRWSILIGVLIGDAFLFLASLFVIKSLGVLGIVAVLFVYQTWKEQGGLSNWKPSMMKSFLRNAKQLGL